MNKKMTFGLGLMLGAVSVYAGDKPIKDDSERNPLGCVHSGYETSLQVLRLYPGTGEELERDHQSLYFMLNRGDKPLKMYQMQKDDSTTTLPLNHVISPHQWAVLATGEPELRYICAVDDGKSSYGTVVDCAKAVKVCQFARVKFGLNNRGNYWVVQSNTRGGAVQEVVRYGIIPR